MKSIYLVFLFSLMGSQFTFCQHLKSEFYLRTPLYILTEVDNKDLPFSGSGFVINRNGFHYLITNYHNISDVEYYSRESSIPWKKRTALIVYGFNKERKMVQIRLPLYVDNIAHFTLLRRGQAEGDLISIKITDTTTIDFADVPYKVFNFDYAQKGSYDCFYVGFPGCKGLPLPLTANTFLRRFDKDSFRLANHPAFTVWSVHFSSVHGFSGSPVFQFDSNNNARLIGVLSGDVNHETIIWPAHYIEELMAQTPE
jgi:Trypsin-like peptidase domain